MAESPSSTLDDLWRRAAKYRKLTEEEYDKGAGYDKDLVAQLQEARKLLGADIDRQTAETLKVDFATVAAAYAAGNQAAVKSHPNASFIVAACRSLQLHRHRYEDVRALATACCKAAQVLHTAGLMCRDFRMANIVQLGPGASMLIDPEPVGTAQAQVPKGFALNGWDDDTLCEFWRYTTLADMHQIGLMIDEQLQVTTDQPSNNALDFVDQLMHKKYQPMVH